MTAVTTTITADDLNTLIKLERACKMLNVKFNVEMGRHVRWLVRVPHLKAVMYDAGLYGVCLSGHGWGDGVREAFDSVEPLFDQHDSDSLSVERNGNWEMCFVPAA